MRRSRGVAHGAALVLALAALSACASNDRMGGSQPETTAAPPPAPPEPPPPAPPPVDLAGKWKLSAAGGKPCFMTFGNSPSTVDQGTIAPAGGCPGNFFTSRKWSYDHDRLIVRDYKSQVLVELSFANGSFSGKDLNGTAITLAR